MGHCNCNNNNSFNPKDKFFLKAKEKGYRARSIFKLEEVQNTYRFLKEGQKVLDLGAYPGSFMQYIIKVIGDKGFLIGLDLQEIKKFPQKNIKLYKADIFDDLIYDKIRFENNIDKFDVISSDLAPATSGIKSLDAGRSFELNNQVLKVSLKYLKRGGSMLIKVFPGEEFDQLKKDIKLNFSKIRIYKPSAVRKTSREVYLLATGKN